MPLVWEPLARRIVAFLGCCLLFLAIVAPASADDASLQAQRKVTVGALKSFPPYYLLDEDGNPTGFAVDAMNEVAKRAGFKVTYRVSETGGSFKALLAGDIDIIPSLGISDYRKQYVQFTQPVDTYRIVLFVRDDTQDITGIDDMAGRPVAVVVNNVGYRYLEKKRPDIQIKVFPKFSDALFALLSAKVDAFAYPEPVAWKLAREADVSEQIKIAAKPLFETKRGMAVRKNNTELLAVLDRAVGDFIASPEYQQVYLTWFGKPYPFWTIARVAWTMGGAIAVIILSMGWWRYRAGVRLNRALQKSEKQFKGMFENAGVGVAKTTPDGHFLLVNDRFVDIVGHDRERLLSGSFQDITHPEDLKNNLAAKKDLLADRKQNYVTEKRYIRADGSTVWSAMTVVVVRDDSEAPEYLIAVIQDITERKRAEEALHKSEERFKDFAEIASDWFWEMDENLRFTFFSSRRQELTGLSPDENVGRTRWEAAGVDPDKNEHWREHRATLEAHETFRDFQYDYTVADSQQIITSVSGKPTFDEAGVFKGYRGTATDITERKLAETKLRESEERLQRSVIDAPNPIMIHAEDGEVLMISNRWTELSGYSHSDIPNILDWTEKAYGVDKNHMRERIGDLYEIEEPYEDEAFVTTASGEQRIWDFRTAPLGRLPDGRRFVISMAVDITERKQAEEAVHDLDKRLRGAIESLQEGFTLFDAEDRLVLANDVFRRINPKASEYLDKRLRFEDLIRANIKSGRIVEAKGREEEFIRERMEQHRNPKGSIIRQFSDGNWYILKETRTPEGGTALTFNDITELKQSEEALKESQARLENILDNSPAPIYFKDTESRFIVANKRYQKMYDVKFEDIKGKTSKEIFGGNLGDAFFDHDREVLNSGKAIEREENFFGRHYLTLKFPIVDPNGVLLGLGGIETDVTEIKVAEEGHRQALVKAEEANQAKSEFLATMSHEFRTPLNAILGFADILTNQYFGPIDDKYQEYAEDIEASGQHLLTLVNDILDLSTIEAGKQSLVKEKLSTMEIVTECERIIEDRARSKGIDLITKIPKDLPPLYADRRASKQIVLNLLSNAVKFTPEGGRITVSAKASKKNTTLKIADTGRGIPPEKLPGLTDPFTRVDGDPYLAEKGWGLGLRITQSLIGLHDGTLDIKSKVGKGTTVTVTFPNEA